MLVAKWVETLRAEGHRRTVCTECRDQLFEDHGRLLARSNGSATCPVRSTAQKANLYHVPSVQTSTPRRNERGNEILSSWSCTGRYVIDAAPDFKSEGWLQYDTNQDAAYFGVWVNKAQRLVLSYAEGDWSVVVCADDAHFDAEILRMCRLYEPGFIAKTYTCGEGWETHRQDRREFFINVPIGYRPRLATPATI